MKLLTVQREEVLGDGIPGTLALDGEHECLTLERESKKIPAGSYPLTLTVSARAKEGTLWTPDPFKRLPLIVVPGRSGIRIHAANYPEQLEGCLAVGTQQKGPNIFYSRSALIALWQKLVESQNFSFTIDIHDPVPVESEHGSLS